MSKDLFMELRAIEVEQAIIRPFYEQEIMELQQLQEMKRGLLFNIQEAERSRTGKLKLPKLKENLQKVEEQIIVLIDPKAIIIEEAH